DRAAIRHDVPLERRLAEPRKVDSHDPMRLGKAPQLRRPHARVGDARMYEGDGRPLTVDVEPDAHPSSAKRGRTNSSNVSRSQLATVTGVRARTEAVRGICIASATSPK